MTLTISDIINKLTFKQRRSFTGSFHYKNFRGVFTEGSLALFTKNEVEGKSAFRGYFLSASDACNKIDSGEIKE